MHVDADFDCCLAIMRQFCMAVKFGDVDKVESAANFCKRPLTLYPETHSTIWRFTGITTTREEGFDLESCQSVIFESLTLS